MCTTQDEVLIHPVIGAYDSDIVGIPGYWWDDGRVDLLTNDGWVRLLAPANEIITDIRVRRIVRGERQVG
jgi:hypothetical protein